MTRTRIDLSLEPTPPRESPDEAFRARLLDAAKRGLTWHAGVSHASVSGRAPDGRTVTAYAKQEAPGYVSAWIREGGAVEPVQEERDRTYVAQERLELASAEVRNRRRKREVDPRIWKGEG